MVEAFLLGVIATVSVTAGVFLLKFWRATRDVFFLAFAAAFIIDRHRMAFLYLRRLNEGSPCIYLARLFC